MKSFKSTLSRIPLFIHAAVAVTAVMLASSAPAQLVAYDDAGNYLATANWTNGANQGFGFTPWAIAANGPDSHGNYILSLNVPAFVIDSVTNVLGTNYTDVFGLFANGTNDINETAAYRGFASPLGTNTFKMQWGSRGAGVTTTFNSGVQHGLCGLSLRNGNITNTSSDYQSGALLYVYFQDGNAPATLYILDNNGVQSVPGTSFSDLGRGNITNAGEVEVTPAPDGVSYILILKDVVQGRTLFTTNGTFIGGSSNTVDSVALFCHETTGDQVYNRMQIAIPRIPPTISNLQPADGSLYLDANATSLSFEVDSFNSTVTSSLVSVYLNGVPQPGLTFNTGSPTNKLLVNCAATLAADTLYNYTITAQDANGNVTSNTYTFNTFLATDLYIDASDYNYTSGLFVNSSTPNNAYANLLGTNGTDYVISDLSASNNTAGYRPNDLPQILTLNTDATGDPVDHANLRLNGKTAYNIGFTDTGNWEDYTRVLPSPTNYSIYARAASGGGGQFEIEELVNSSATTTNQPLAALGRVNVPNTGGSKVFAGQLTPLTDIFGNTVVVPLSGTKTLRTTAISSKGYNLEYLVVVAVTNAANPLRPYIATGSPVPNATGVSLTSQITFNIANRQTLVTTNTIQLFLNSTNVTSRLVLSSNAAGTTATWTPTNNLQPNFTNTVTVIFSDAGGVSSTNSWSFVTGAVGGALGNGVWSAGGGADLNWSTAANWSGGTPGIGFNASFASVGATTSLVVNNIISTNVTIQGLFYNTNNSGYHTTMIADGVTLTVTNGSTGIAAIVQVGGGTGSDNVFNKQVTNTITGAGGTLFVSGNSAASGLANQLNFQVRQSASPAAVDQTVLDMSGLGTLIATVGKFYVAQGGANTSLGQTNVTGRVNLARTNTITCLRANAGQFEVGDSSGGTFTLPGSTLNLGIVNSFFVDTVRFGKQKAINNLIRFNPIFTNGITPTAFIRGSNGPATRVTTWTIADADTEATVPVSVSANCDLSGGTVDALVNTLIVGRGATTATDTGSAQGTLTLTGGTLDVLNLTNGVQRAVNTASVTAIVNINGTATLISPNIVLAKTAGGSGPVLGTLNIINGSVKGSIVAGGGTSTVNVNAGTLTVTGTAGTAAARLSALILTSGSLHLSVDGNNTTTASVNAASVTASGTTITIDSVTNVGTHAVTVHLITYTGSGPFAGLALAPIYGYSGHLVDNSGSIDLTLTAAAPPSPSIRNIVVNGSQVVIGGTNNFNGAGGTYNVLTSTNVALPLTNWTLLNSGSFGANGSFLSTNTTGTNQQRFYILRAP